MLLALSARAQLEVTVSNIAQAKGSVIIAIYNESQYWLDSSPDTPVFRDASNTVTSTEDATFLFEDIPAGTYAISVFHDLDDDGKLATNFIGFPKEPYGFSGGHGKYGPPDFEKASFVVGEEALSIEVELK
jgi:uncharacterized protein (DUF2141 family)